MNRAAIAALSVALAAGQAAWSQVPVAEAAADQMPSYSLSMGVRRPTVFVRGPMPLPESRPTRIGAGPVPVTILGEAAGLDKAVEGAVQQESPGVHVPWKIASEGSGSVRVSSSAIRVRELMRSIRLDWEVLRRLTASGTNELIPVFAARVAASCGKLKHETHQRSRWAREVRGIEEDLRALIAEAEHRARYPDEHREELFDDEGCDPCPPSLFLESAARHCTSCHQHYGGPMTDF